jgi:hypothetical protein
MFRPRVLVASAVAVFLGSTECGAQYAPDAAAFHRRFEELMAQYNAAAQHGDLGAADAIGRQMTDLIMQERTALQRMRAQHCTGGELHIGMSASAAIRAWCNPDAVNTTETRGHKREQWVYAKRGYLYFEDGRLTTIQREQ